MKMFFENNLPYNKVKLPGINGNAYSASKYLYRDIYRDGVIDESLDEKMAKYKTEYKGGIIIFSTDVNSKEMDSNKAVNKIKQILSTLGNRLFSMKKIDKTVSEVKPGGWTVGKFLHGRYFDKNDNVFDENSLSLELVGVDTDSLDSIAYNLLSEFNQESVLVKNYNDSEIYFVYDE